jgi:hypothetical protein
VGTTQFSPGNASEATSLVLVFLAVFYLPVSPANNIYTFLFCPILSKYPVHIGFIPVYIQLTAFKTQASISLPSNLRFLVEQLAM